MVLFIPFQQKKKTKLLNILLISSGCGILINDSLVSPRYPCDYPNNVDCNLLVSIPHGVALEIYFEDFDVEYHSQCV